MLVEAKFKKSVDAYKNLLEEIEEEIMGHEENAPHKGRIIVELDLQDAALKELLDLIDVLEKRLRAVLAYSSEPVIYDNDTTIKDDGPPPLASDLEKNNRLVFKATGKISNIIDRLEL